MVLILHLKCEMKMRVLDEYFSFKFNCDLLTYIHVVTPIGQFSNY